MNREIKFRVWDRKNKRMINSDVYESGEDFYSLISITLKGNIIISTQQQYYPFVNDSEYLNKNFDVMQYTGLKDKNGIEIYDGDIYEELFEKGWLDKSLNKMVYKKYLVKMVVKMQINYCEEYGDIYGYPMDLEKREILGNVYENPELLEGDKNEM